MDSIGRRIITGATAAVLLGAGAAAASHCWDRPQAARVWPRVPLTQAADLDAYRRTRSESRAEVRQRLEGEYAALVQSLAGGSRHPEALLDPALAALLAFDAAHGEQREEAADGMPAYLEAGLRGALDELYRSRRIPPERRRLVFAADAPDGRLGEARAALRRGEAPAAPEDVLAIAGAVDLVASATLTADGETHRLDLSLENLHTGTLCSFAAEGPVEELAPRVAEAVFRSFQAVSYPEPRNPNPHLTWIRPAASEPVATAEQAGYYCAAQGARLPFALELVNAAQAGSAGAAYVAGGIPQLERGPWAVADRQRDDRHHYYFAPAAWAPDSHPAGPVRTAAGLGPIRARYWCVRGEPEARVRRIEELYGTYRQLRSAVGDGDATAALEYLLVGEDALGSRRRFAGSYPSEAVAWRQVWLAECVAGLDQVPELLAANRPAGMVCPAPDPGPPTAGPHRALN